MALKKAKSSPSKARMHLYDKEQVTTAERYKQWGLSLAAGKISRAKFKSLMRADLKRYLIRVALLGKDGRKLTAHDKSDLSKFLAQSYKYLDGFISDLKGYKARLSKAQVGADRKSVV